MEARVWEPGVFLRIVTIGSGDEQPEAARVRLLGEFDYDKIIRRFPSINCPASFAAFCGREHGDQIRHFPQPGSGLLSGTHYPQPGQAQP